MAVDHDYYRKAPMYLPMNYLSGKNIFTDDISMVIVISDEIVVGKSWSSQIMTL